MKVNGVVQRVDGPYAWSGRVRCPGPVAAATGVRRRQYREAFGAARQVLKVCNDAGAQPGEQVGVVIDDGVPLGGPPCLCGAGAWRAGGGCARDFCLRRWGLVDLSAGSGGRGSPSGWSAVSRCRLAPSCRCARAGVAARPRGVSRVSQSVACLGCGADCVGGVHLPAAAAPTRDLPDFAELADRQGAAVKTSAPRRRSVRRGRACRGSTKTT